MLDFQDPFGSIKKNKRKSIPISIKREVVKRQHYKCAKCKKELPARYHIHHKKRVSDGGSNKPSNLIAICANCHSNIHHKESVKKATKKIKKKKSSNPFDLGFGFNKPKRKKKKNPFVNF